MASSATLFSSPNKLPLPSSPPLRGRDSVYVATVPLRAPRGPPRMLMSAAHSLGLWGLQHFIVIIKPDPSTFEAIVYDFQPRDPESIYIALAALSGRPVPGVVLKRTLKKLPKSRCWFVGFSHAKGVEEADKFNRDWETDLIIGKHDCRHYTSGMIEHLTGERSVLDFLR